MSRILVVDDEPHIARTLSISLRARDHQVETVGDGRSALDALEAEPADLVILDLGLPDLDGIEVLRRLRESSQVPVIVLSARIESEDKVEALDAGADDYVTKPFGMEEFLARVRAALRRGPDDTGTPGADQPLLVTADFVLDFSERRALVGPVGGRREEIRLTPTEWRLLAVLARRPGHLVTQQDLLREVWGPTYQRESNYLRVYANQLRRKLEPDPAHPAYLITEPGQGYRLRA